MDAFVQFLWSDEAQRLFVKHGFRSVFEPLNAESPSFGRIADLFSIDDFGGWSKAKQEIVDGVWKKQVMQALKK